MSDEIVNVEAVFTEGDYPTITGTVKDLDGSVIDASSATVELIYWFDKSAPAKLTGSGTAAGALTAKFSAGIPGYGSMHVLFRVTTSGEPFHSRKEWVIKVRRKRLQAAA